MASGLREKIELAEKLQEYITRSGKTQRQLADELGMTESYLSKLTNGVTNWTTSRKYFGPLALALNLSRAEIAALNPLYELAPVANLTLSGRAQEGTLDSPPYTMKPIYDLVQASRPIEDMEPLADLSPVPVLNEHVKPGLLVFQVRGDSMAAGPGLGIAAGDTIYVDAHDLTPQPERVYVIHIPGDGVCLKRVRELGGALWLFSDNPDQRTYPPFRVDEARVVGRVYWRVPGGNAV